MTPLAASAAIVLGASEWPKYPAFETHKAFSNCAEACKAYLLGNGVQDKNLLWLFNDQSYPGGILDKLNDFLRKAEGGPIRNVIVYYVGHGAYREGGYFLALQCTNRNNLLPTMLPIREVARQLAAEAADKRQILIVDACYAAGATKDFIYQGSGVEAEMMQKELRDHLPEDDLDRGTSIFCAAGPKMEAKAPRDRDFTMFSGALWRALEKGDPKQGDLLSLAQVAQMVDRSIRTKFRNEAVRPELHTPKQEKGDIRHLPFFPNPAARRVEGSRVESAFRTQIEGLRRTMSPLDREVEWERESLEKGWYDLLELRMDIDAFGDVDQRHQVVGIHGPTEGEIGGIPYGFAAPADLGTVVLQKIVDQERGRVREGAELPLPGTALSGELEIEPPLSAGSVHKGFTVSTRLVNCFAATSSDAKLRQHPEVENARIRASYSARRLRLIVYFKPELAPSEIRVGACHASEVDEASDLWPEDASETARAATGLFYDRDKGMAVLNIERAKTAFHYVLRWPLPPWPPVSLDDGILAKEQVRALLSLAGRDGRRLDTDLGLARDRICQTHLGYRWDPSGVVELSLLVFDERIGSTRVVATTAGWRDQQMQLPWGAGVVGWTMRRRKPTFVDTTDRGSAGIYRAAPGGPPERYLLCVPIPLPSRSSRRAELLRDLSVPCAVAALGCVDERGNLERLKSLKVFAAVSSQLVKELLDMINATLS